MKSARRILAILLVLCMAAALVACGGGDKPAATPTPASTPDNSGNTPDDGGNTPDDGGSSANGPAELGFYDRSYDYTQHDQYKVAYLVSAAGVMYDSFDTAFTTWAEQLNVNYTGMWAPAEASNEAFLSGVETYADMGYDGLIVDTDPNLGASVAKLCADNDVLFMMGMAQARDYSAPYTIMGESSIGPLLAPNVGFNNVEVGRSLANGLMDWKEEAYPDVSWDKVGFISINFSLSPQINERTLGNKQVWAERSGLGAYNPDPTNNPTNFIIADASSGGFDQATATNLVTQILSNPPAGVEVWLIAGAFWDFAAGAAVAIENMNLTDVACVTTFGSGANATALWDTGDNTCIRISLETASPVFAEAIFNGMWAMMAGLATPDTLWSEWALIWDKGDIYQLTDELDPISQSPIVEIGADGKPVVLEEHGYASMVLPMIWVTPENYVEFYGWVDLYQFGPDVADADRNYPDYPLATDLNLFDARSEVPASWSQYPGN